MWAAAEDSLRLLAGHARKEGSKEVCRIPVEAGHVQERGNWSQTVSELLGEAKQWLSHGQPMYWNDAKIPRSAWM
jgi:hypothetical protein